MKYILVLLITLVANMAVKAQSGSRVQLDPKTMIVKDSAGKVYEYSEWAQMLATGNCDLIPVKNGDEKKEFLLKKLSEEERQKKIARMPKPGPSRNFKSGTVIGNFKAEDMNGNAINLEELRGKIVVLNFWFINCGPCRMEMPELNKLVAEYKDSSNIVFIGISTDDKKSIKKFLAKSEFNFTIVPDGHPIASSYNVAGYPTTVIIDQQGKIGFHTAGYGLATVHWIDKSIKELLKPAQ